MHNYTHTDRINIRLMAMVLAFSTIIMIIKFVAYYYTRSTAVLTDALESIINVVAGGFALFSIYYAARPKDTDHPYGHGKIEALSAGFEGGLVLIAAVGIGIKSVINLYKGTHLHTLDIGIVLTAITGFANLCVGYILIKKGKETNSVTMRASGKHLMTDAITSAGLVFGLILIYLTGYTLIDGAIALVFAFIILKTGLKLIKGAISNLLDEADQEQLEHLSRILNSNRRINWIDIHNLRVLKYGRFLHVDCHLTLPWYLTLEQAHEEVTALENLVKREMGDDIEFFIHADPCLPSSCQVCNKADCKVRQKPFVRLLDWDLNNMLPDNKHSV